MFKDVVQYVPVANNLFQEVVNKKFVAPPVHKVTNFYTHKIIKAGDIVEVYQYENGVYEGFESFHHEGKKKTTNKKRTDNINKAKKNIRRLINTNVNKMSLFITLTYKDNISDVTKCKDDFKKFVKRWNYRRKKAGLTSLQYVYVVEFQKRGALHFHCIFFNAGFIANKVLNALWQKGFVRVNKINNVDNVGSYVVKYMQKDLVDSRLNGRDLYGRSRNLKEPVVIKCLDVTTFITKNLCHLVYQSAFQNDYRGTIVYYQFNLKRFVNCVPALKQYA